MKHGANHETHERHEKEISFVSFVCFVVSVHDMIREDSSSCPEPTRMEILIDEMRPEDWDQVRQIYLDGLATGQATFEVEAPSWEAWNKSHHAHSRLVARCSHRVIAWAALAPVSVRQCYAGVAEVSLYVSADQRDKGVGLRLLQAVIDSSERHGIWTLCGATFPENTASINLQLA